jgi:hypothetical protein
VTGWQWLAVAALGLGAFSAIVAAYVIGTAHAELDDDSYWRGFADGEEMQRQLDRIPSPN